VVRGGLILGLYMRDILTDYYLGVQNFMEVRHAKRGFMKGPRNAIERHGITRLAAT